MQPLLLVFFSSLFAGLAMPLGAVLAHLEHFKNPCVEEELRHGIVALGAGALLSAVALVLVPEGIKDLSIYAACGWFLLGGIGFMLLDIYLKKINTPASQLAAMLSDFVPESIALGAAFSSGHSSAYLLAAMIALQNIPEGFSAYRELSQSRTHRAKVIIQSFAIMALLGPICALIGFTWLSDQPDIVAAIMLFAAGGIMYSIFQDIAPQVKLEKHWFPPLGAVLGFMLGIIGFMITA